MPNTTLADYATLAELPYDKGTELGALPPYIKPFRIDGKNDASFVNNREGNKDIYDPGFARPTGGPRAYAGNHPHG